MEAAEGGIFSSELIYVAWRAMVTPGDLQPQPRGVYVHGYRWFWSIKEGEVRTSMVFVPFIGIKQYGDPGFQFMNVCGMER